MSREESEKDLDYRHPARVVNSYLTHLEERDLDSAQQYVSGEFSIVTATGELLSSLEELVERSNQKYSSVKKDRLHTDTIPIDRESSWVISRGFLQGRLKDGTSVNDVRYVDVFLVERGRIRSQEIYNHTTRA